MLYYVRSWTCLKELAYFYTEYYFYVIHIYCHVRSNYYKLLLINKGSTVLNN